MILAVLAVTSGAEGYEAIEEFGKNHYQTLRKRLRLPNGIPSHDTRNRVFQAIKFRQFERLFLEWTEGLKPEGSAEHVIAIDGKTVRGSRDGYYDNHAIHLVHAWSVENGICLGQRKTRDKSNEITAIPELLDMLCIEGAIITIDAMGTQTAMAKRIVGGGADYIRHIRSHWGVENSLHWVLDMSFGEDRQRKRAGMAAENFALVRKCSLNILKRETGKGSLVTKRLKAVWSIDYLFSLLEN